ncbi:MAG TPA: TrmH family RNA methyltransferase [Thermoanaerobaculia bacterium]|nr:TrmH family RNA methyltransferase [Thermoanaerobaculia bacterium]
MLEGPHLVGEAIAAGLPLETLLVTPELAATAGGRFLVAGAGGEVEEIAAPLLAGLMDADTPQGALAIVHLPRRGADALPRTAGGHYLFVDGVQDPGNLGALARVAEAAGAAGLACAPGTAHPNHPRALRASAGSLLRLPVAWEVGPAEVDDRLTGLRPRWVALVAHGGRDLYTEALEGTLVLALGAEGGGLSPAARARADLALEIPIAPPVESLNVATAAAVVLFELRRRAALSSPSLP